MLGHTRAPPLPAAEPLARASPCPLTRAQATGRLTGARWGRRRAERAGSPEVATNWLAGWPAAARAVHAAGAKLSAPHALAQTPVTPCCPLCCRPDPAEHVRPLHQAGGRRYPERRGGAAPVLPPAGCHGGGPGPLLDVREGRTLPRSSSVAEQAPLLALRCSLWCAAATLLPAHLTTLHPSLAPQPPAARCRLSWRARGARAACRSTSSASTSSRSGGEARGVHARLERLGCTLVWETACAAGLSHMLAESPAPVASPALTSTSTLPQPRPPLTAACRPS